MRQVIDTYVATGKIRFEYKHYIVIDNNVGGSESRRAAEASECANEQGQFWNYTEMVFANQDGEGNGAFADRRLKAFAAELGLDTAQFNSCFDSGKYASAVQADEATARALGVSGTPTLFLNGQRVTVNVLDFNALSRLIDSQLAGR